MPGYYHDLGPHRLEILGFTAREPRGIVLVLPGQGVTTAISLEDLNRSAIPLELVCAVLDARGSWWSDRLEADFDPAISPEQFVTHQVTEWAAAQWPRASQRLGLLGWGVGGQAVLRIGFKNPVRFGSVAAIEPAIDLHDWYGHGSTLDTLYTSREQCRQNTALMLIQPSRHPAQLEFVCPPDSPWLRGCDRLHEKLIALGVPHECDLSFFMDTVSGETGSSRAISRLLDNLAQAMRKNPLNLH